LLGESAALAPGFDSVAEAALWLRAVDSLHLTADHIGQIANALQPLCGIIWFLTSRSGQAPSIREYLRAFGDRKGLRDRLVAKVSLTFLDSKSVAYSDVAWVGEDSHESVADLLAQNSASRYCALSFIPANQRTAEAWARLSVSLASQALWSDALRWIPKERKDSEEATAIMLQYIRHTRQLSGMASLVWIEHAVKSGLVFFGDNTELNSIAARLRPGNELVSSETFSVWYRSGAHVPALG
jgi:hypothetical protein